MVSPSGCKLSSLLDALHLEAAVTRILSYQELPFPPLRAATTRIAHIRWPQRRPPQPPLRKGGSPETLPRLSYSPPCEGGVGGGLRPDARAYATRLLTALDSP